MSKEEDVVDPSTAEKRPPTESEKAKLYKEVQDLIGENEELRTIVQLGVLGYRLYLWAMAACEEQPNLTWPMLYVVSTMTQQASMQPFFIDDVAKALYRKTSPTKAFLQLAARRASKDRVDRERSLNEIRKRIRRDDIPLPSTAMSGQFPDGKFTPESILLIYGPRKSIRCLLRRVGRDYERGKGKAALLMDEANDKEDFTTVMPAAWYREGSRTTGDLIETLKPIAGKADLLLIDDLEILLPTDPLDSPRNKRLHRTAMTLVQWQMVHTMGVIAGIPTDDDVDQGSPIDTRYEIMSEIPHVSCLLTEVGNTTKLVVETDLLDVEPSEL